MTNDNPTPETIKRRGFLQSLTGGAAAVSSLPVNAAAEKHAPIPERIPGTDPLPELQYPRLFSGRQLSQIAFPLGGIGTGCISLGGRGQLRDWEVFNRPSKGLTPEYAFASIWAKIGDGKPVASVLESRILPPYGSDEGLGSTNAPGLRRLESAKFSGQFPFAALEFEDPELPVQVSLEAFSPFIPLDAEQSGYPAAVLRYRVRNHHREGATVSVAFSLENPIGMPRLLPPGHHPKEARSVEYREESQICGFLMTNPALAAKDPINGSFALALLRPTGGEISYLRGWPNAKWWASPMLFWNDFVEDGKLGPESEQRKPYSSLCLQQTIAGNSEAEYTFLLGWHLPNRTPGWCGWDAPEGHENDIIGNHYCTRFSSAWEAVLRLAKNLAELERRTRSFTEAVRVSTLPAGVRDAAMANLSTLVTQTSFRTADGEFHGFEGCNDQHGCCFGNCTHVWNYESTTQHLFPQLARSLRKAAFGFSEDEQGGMRHRQLLPDNIQRYAYAAADGQMGQIIKLYLDWRLSGDTEWLRSYWPRVEKAVSFAWVAGGWDANRDGVLEGVQHNTYDVEFYGPNPLCGIYYLGALRAAEEIARVLGESEQANRYHDLFRQGSQWIDTNLFNGEYYIQRVRSIPHDQIAPATVSGMGSETSQDPEFQLGEGCLADQLIGQYQADLAGLGPLLDSTKIRTALESVNRYNYRADLLKHNNVQRVYALNDEPALLVCDYGRKNPPKIPFPYYEESWTGIEYLVGSQMIFTGMVEQGLRCIENVRRRYDGERRNPWNEPECGHHYARAMSAWSGVIACSGFDYHAAQLAVVARPRLSVAKFRSFWSTAAAWGSFEYSGGSRNLVFTISVTEGALRLRSLALLASTNKTVTATLGAVDVPASLSQEPAGSAVAFEDAVSMRAGEELRLRFVA